MIILVILNCKGMGLREFLALHTVFLFMLEATRFHLQRLLKIILIDPVSEFSECVNVAIWNIFHWKIQQIYLFLLLLLQFQ